MSDSFLTGEDFTAQQEECRGYEMYPEVENLIV